MRTKKIGDTRTTDDDNTDRLFNPPPNLAEQIERSLLAGESYEEFTARLLKQMGIDSDQPAGALAKFEAQVENEAREAWNAARASDCREKT